MVDMSSSGQQVFPQLFLLCYINKRWSHIGNDGRCLYEKRTVLNFTVTLMKRPMALLMMIAGMCGEMRVTDDDFDFVIIHD